DRRSTILGQCHSQIEANVHVDGGRFWLSVIWTGLIYSLKYSLSFLSTTLLLNRWAMEAVTTTSSTTYSTTRTTQQIRPTSKKRYDSFKNCRTSSLEWTNRLDHRMPQTNL